MQPVSLLLNVLWIFLGGAWMAFGWLVAAVVMAITIVGLPWARAAFNIAAYTLVLAGWWLALGHVITALILAVTIIGIPFAWAHLKLAGIALWPIGRTIVPV